MEKETTVSKWRIAFRWAVVIAGTPLWLSLMVGMQCILGAISMPLGFIAGIENMIKYWATGKKEYLSEAKDGFIAIVIPSGFILFGLIRFIKTGTFDDE
ncbi:hypothetical protein CLV58_12540 [Spirosoma oryzae]|uniref:Uncharacterized protein n=1 Tax=Spirosoma oryzae TaxID=1469603 RepID=A0A2T0S8M0_9BACT|nr:hypothetical protein [Spirosoma oryzae]PRY29778.1 hypothetical protein CLV58_12540 [Spirosoma oryzae]